MSTLSTRARIIATAVVLLALLILGALLPQSPIHLVGPLPWFRSRSAPSPSPGATVPSGSPGTGAATPVPRRAAPVPGLKPALDGELDRNGPPAFAWMQGYVVNVAWDELQAAQGAGITPGNPIDRAIAEVDAWNQANPAGQRGLKVRLFMGTTSPGRHASPTWVQNLGGPPVTVTGFQGQSCQVGRYWTAAFQQAYADLQAKLAARYDAAPEIREVTLSMVSLCYAEPFLHYDWPALSAAGDTLGQDEAAYTAMMEAHRVWKHTLQDLAFNPYNVPGGGSSFTEQEIGAFRSLFEAQGVLENNSLRSTPMGSSYAALYQAIQANGPPITFQTATPSAIGDPQAALDLAVSLGAASVELPSGYQSWPQSMLLAEQAKLLASPA